MNSPLYKQVALPSLDRDLQELVLKGQADVIEVVLLQLLRLGRGRPHEVTSTPVKGWSPDGGKT